MSVHDLDSREFRSFAGHFATGVAIITTLDESGTPVGFTANSLTSLSLDPPMFLVCVARDSGTLPSLLQHSRFGISFLSDAQRDLSIRFAGKGGGAKFSDTGFLESPGGIPWLAGALGHAECEVSTVYEGGDHMIVLGTVSTINFGEGEPLVYFRGDYAALSGR
jgi:flavin reductase (DIM6/NTAB) family NADH-FMN oxidoreductase RutF